MITAAHAGRRHAGEVAVDLPGDAAGPAGQPEVAGGAAVDLDLVVAAADRLDLGADLRAEVVGQRHADIIAHVVSVVHMYFRVRSAAMSRRVAIVSDAASYVGPDLARVLADRGHDLVVGDPADGLVADLEARGAAVEVVEGVRDLAEPEAAERLVAAALDRFGRIDSATAFTGRIVVGRFLKSSVEDLQAALAGCIEAPYRFLRDGGPHDGRAGRRPGAGVHQRRRRPAHPGAPLYSSARAGANMLVRNVAAEVAGKGVQVNAIGTNFMDFPGFLGRQPGRGRRGPGPGGGPGADGPPRRARRARRVLGRVRRRHQPLRHRPVRRLRRRLDVTDAPDFPLPNNDADLTGQVALVTGASSGLGWRFAQVLAAAGATVVAGARRVDRLEALAEEIEASGGTCRGVALDVTDAESFAALLDDIEAHEGLRHDPGEQRRHPRRGSGPTRCRSS